MSDMNMAGLRHHGDFVAWKDAKRVHQLEHASGVKPTLECEVVGHSWNPEYHEDDYSGIFDDDDRRKFCIATNREW